MERKRSHGWTQINTDKNTRSPSAFICVHLRFHVLLHVGPLMKILNSIATLWIAALLVAALPTPAARLKDLVTIEGVRDNLLIGYGLVVGLAGTGDGQQTLFSIQSLSNLLRKMGVNVPPAGFRVNNIAAVMVTATLPPFATPGGRIDVTVSSIGDAETLQGGTLVLTPLKAADGEIYAVAQGAVSIGGFSAGQGGSGVQVNHPTVGRIPEGALIEQDAPSVVPDPANVRLQLRRPDHVTASRIAAALNQTFPNAVAEAANAAVVTVRMPAAYAQRAVDFIAEIDAIDIETDRRAKVVLNERTGTVVIGSTVKIAPVAVLHGNLTVQVVTDYRVSQPAPLSAGQTVVTPQVGVQVQEQRAREVKIQDGATVEELIAALMAIGSTPRDIIAIMQSIAAAGALDAELEMI